MHDEGAPHNQFVGSLSCSPQVRTAFALSDIDATDRYRYHKWSKVVDRYWYVLMSYRPILMTTRKLSTYNDILICRKKVVDWYRYRWYIDISDIGDIDSVPCANHRSASEGGAATDVRHMLVGFVFSHRWKYSSQNFRHLLAFIFDALLWGWLVASYVLYKGLLCAFPALYYSIRLQLIEIE